ncbi:hypothetical protein [Janthinobacterium sp. PC23-8]|uniref:hypothetical protein n=1 Tax=Janthinobacterium sp. PC23-8 TaxID=2012679 RepID=UPI00113FD6E7|nr:hypothetical protein [Janthinobacterium sp. PC23-8]
MSALQLRRNGWRDASLRNKKLQAMLWLWNIPLPQKAQRRRHDVSRASHHHFPVVNPQRLQGVLAAQAR